MGNVKGFNMCFNQFVLNVLSRFGYDKLPDSLFLRVKYFLMTGRVLHLRHPERFTEKIQWLKLYNRKAEYTTLVDKIAVKDYISDVIGRQYVIPTIDVWSTAEAIDFDKLPEKFVLKTNNGGGSNGVVVCKDKSRLNVEETIAKLNVALKKDIYKSYREWPYKDVQPKIFAEQLVEMRQGTDLPDYKFFCFDGNPLYCQVIGNRSSGMSIDFFDKEWRHQNFREPKEYPFASVCPEKPVHFEEMWALAEKLSCGIPFVRVDFYDTGDKVYFGEITFFPTSGMQTFVPDSWDKVFGSFITCPK